MDWNELFVDECKKDIEEFQKACKGLWDQAQIPVEFEVARMPLDIPPREIYSVLRARILPQLCELSNINRKLCENTIIEHFKGVLPISRQDLRADIKEVVRERSKARKNETEESDLKPEHTACFEGLVDLVLEKGQIAFLIREGDKLDIVTEVNREDKILIPPPRDQIKWLLPRAEEVLRYYREDNDSKLYDDLVAYHKGISEVPNEKFYDLFAAWDFHTYMQEAIEFSPYIWLYSIQERGKSRTGRGLVHVSYRGCHVESLRQAYLLRFADRCHGSLFFDVREITKKAEKNDSEDILLHRFEKSNAMVARVIYPERGEWKDTVYYDIFGPTVVATNESMSGPMRTRSIQIVMQDSDIDFNDDITPEYGRSFRERLVAFRARHLGEQLPPLPEGFRVAKKRLGDILREPYRIMLLVKPDRTQRFLDLAKEIQQDRKQENQQTLDAEIVRVLPGLLPKTSDTKTVIGMKEITEQVNAGRVETDKKVESRYVSYKLGRMGFKRELTAERRSGILWDPIVFRKLCATFGIEQEQDADRDGEETPERNLL